MSRPKPDWASKIGNSRFFDKNPESALMKLCGGKKTKQEGGFKSKHPSFLENFTNPPGISNEQLLKQAYKESSFRPNVTNSLGFKGLAQVGDAVISDYKKEYKLSGFDPFDPESAKDIQRWYMDNLYNSSFANKPNQSEQVREAKAFAAYNWGRGNVVRALTKAKKTGQDIYNSMEWLNSMPKETSDYVNRILGLDKAFNKEFDSVRQLPKHKNVVKHYQTKK